MDTLNNSISLTMDTPLKIAIPHGNGRLVPGLTQSICLSKTSSDKIICTGMTPANGGCVFTPSTPGNSRLLGMLMTPTDDRVHMTPMELTATHMHVTVSPTVSEDTTYHGAHSSHSNPLSPIPDAADKEESDPFEEGLIRTNDDALFFSPKASQVSFECARPSVDELKSSSVDISPDVTPEPVDQQRESSPLHQNIMAMPAGMAPGMAPRSGPGIAPKMTAGMAPGMMSAVFSSPSTSSIRGTPPPGRCLQLRRSNIASSSPSSGAMSSPSPSPPLRTLKLRPSHMSGASSPSSSSIQPLRPLQLRPSNVALPPLHSGPGPGPVHHGHGPRGFGSRNERDLKMPPMKIVVTPYTPEHHEVTMVAMGDHEDSPNESSNSYMTNDDEEDDQGFVVMTHSDPEDDEVEHVEVQQDEQDDDEDENKELSDLDEEDYSDSDEYDSDSSSLPLDMLFGLSAQYDEDIVFAENGYKKFGVFPME